MTGLQGPWPGGGSEAQVVIEALETLGLRYPRLAPAQGTVDSPTLA